MGAFREIALLFGVQTDGPSFARADKAMAAFVAQQQKRAAQMDAASRPAKPAAEPFGKGAPEALKDSGISLADGLTGQVGVIAGAAEKLANVLANAVQQVAELGSRINRTTVGFKVNAAELQSWEYAAGRVGVSGEALAGIMSSLEGKAYGAATGMDAGAVMAFSRLGVKIRGASGQLRSGMDLLDAGVERIRKLPNTIATQQKVIAVYGEELGRQLVGAVQSGRFDEWRKDFRDFGAELSGDALEAVKRYGNETSKLGLIMKGLRQSAATPLIDSLARIGKQVTEQLRGDRTGNQALAQATAQFAKLEDVAVKIGVWLYKALPYVGLVIEGFAAIGNVLGAVVEVVIDRVLPAFDGMGKFLVPLGAAVFAAFFPLTALFGGIFLILDDLITYSKGGDSLFGRMLYAFHKWEADFLKGSPNDPPWLVFLRDAYKLIAEELPAAWRAFKATVENWDAGIRKGGNKLYEIGARVERGLTGKNRLYASPEMYQAQNQDIEDAETPEGQKRRADLARKLRAWGAGKPFEQPQASPGGPIPWSETPEGDRRAQLLGAAGPVTPALSAPTAPLFPEQPVPTVPIASYQPGGSSTRPVVVQASFAPVITVNAEGFLKEGLERTKTQIEEGVADFWASVVSQIGQAPQ